LVGTDQRKRRDPPPRSGPGVLLHIAVVRDCLGAVVLLPGAEPWVHYNGDVGAVCCHGFTGRILGTLAIGAGL
jgi:hypothetical protein